MACLGDPAAACTVAEDAAGHHRTSAELHFQRAVLHSGLGRDDEAARAARRAIALDRGLAVAHFLLGTILRRTGDACGSRAAYRTAAELASARPPEELLPLADGTRAARLAEAARIHAASLKAY